MNELNISAVDATAMETAATASAPKHKWLSKLTRGAKKATMFCTIAGVMASTCVTQAFAAGTGAVDTSSFISTALLLPTVFGLLPFPTVYCFGGFSP